ncbi:MAG: 3-dehydroquinate synthase [Bacteroidota bacterium]
MKVIYENASTGVYMGEAWSLLNELIEGQDLIIITDTNVGELYGHSFPDCPVIRIGTGEIVKEMDTVLTIIKHLLVTGADRSSFLLGIGGGVVCDITGFVASVYMRGIPFGFVSTSLLSQVDASIGGKNGLNVNGIKNVIGCFNQPSFVICDTSMLKTLPDEEFVSGLGEIVKHALIRDAEMFDLIEQNISKLLAGENELLEELISGSIAIKASVVEKDEKEMGERRILNFGHTLGHAIEAQTGMSHGISISAGMMAAVGISCDEGLLSSEEAGRIRSVMESLGLLPALKLQWPELGEKILADKKKKGDNICFILLEGIGKAKQVEFPFHEIIYKLSKNIS